MAKADDLGRRLPSGPHGIPPELVGRNQRERLIAAMAEVCGEQGYAATSVAEISKRAGVSTASFYRQFKDRKECLLASFEEIFERLLAGIEGVCADGGETDADRARSGIAVAAQLLASDPPAARLLTVEIVAAGPDGVLAQHRAIERLAALLRESGGPSDGRPDRAWAAVAAMTSLAGRRASENRTVSTAELEAVGAPP